MPPEPTAQTKNITGRLFVPDDTPEPACLERITHLGVGAHHDDLEFMAFHGIVECHGKNDQWFGGVTCTDGKGSSRSGVFADMKPEELGKTRSGEQIEAARIGGYGAMIQLDHPSSLATNPADTSCSFDSSSSDWKPQSCSRFRNRFEPSALKPSAPRRRCRKASRRGE